MNTFNEEAINELMELINEVKEVQILMSEFGINYASDGDMWTATSFNEETGSLHWNKELLKKMNGMKTGDIIVIGACVVTGAEHQYKTEKYFPAPKKLAEVQGDIVSQYLQSIVQSLSLKHFTLKFDNPYGLYNNCGWEQFLGIEATIKSSALQADKTTELIKEIKNEQDNIIELSGSPVYTNPKNNFNKNSGLIPQGEFPYMVEFFSNLVLDEDTVYQGTFGLNSKYIKDAMKLITQVENRAEELADKYADKGVKVTVNGLNDGCEKGMAIYVWIPYQ